MLRGWVTRKKVSGDPNPGRITLKKQLPETGAAFLARIDVVCDYIGKWAGNLS
jgi:hypothetical protein